MITKLFIGGLIGYAETQAYGFAALFGLVEDLKLYSLSIVNGQAVIDTSKYQWTAAIVALGAASVSPSTQAL